MARYRGTVISTRSAEETFDYLADFSNAAAWDPGTATAERLDDGPVGLGSAFRLGVRVGARVIPLEYRIVAFDRPHRVVLLGESGAVRSEDTVTVTPAADGGSILTYEADLRLKGAWSAWPTRSFRSSSTASATRASDGLRHRARRPARPDGTTARPARPWPGASTGFWRPAWSGASPPSARVLRAARPAGPRLRRWPVAPCW